MKIILFGKTGSGKSLLGEYLQNHYGFRHFDADQILTKDMKTCIKLGKPMSQRMIDNYVELVKTEIANINQKYMNTNVVISQALYRNKNRIDLAKGFPNLKFFWINAEEEVCYKRVFIRSNWITVDYAKKINHLFELPKDFNFFEIKNNNDFNLNSAVATVARRPSALKIEDFLGIFS